MFDRSIPSHSRSKRPCSFLRGLWLSVDEEGEGERRRGVLGGKRFLVSEVSLF